MFWKKEEDKKKKAGLAFTLFGGQSLVSVDEEPVHICSCGSASDLFLVCVKSGAINLYGTSNDAQSTPRLLYTITPMNPIVLALACCPPPHFAVVTVEPENPHSAINVVRVYRPPLGTPALEPYLRQEGCSTSTPCTNKSETASKAAAMYELPMHASVTSIAVCAATGRLAVVTQGDITIWAPEPDAPEHVPAYDKLMHIYVPDVKKIAIYRNCLAYSNEVRVRVLEFSIAKARPSSAGLSGAGAALPTALGANAGSGGGGEGGEGASVRLQGGPTGLQDSEYFLSICSGQSTSAIPVVNFGAGGQKKRDSARLSGAVRFGPTSEVGITVKLDAQYVMRSVQLLVYARYAEAAGPVNTLELVPEYLYLSPPGGSPYALREVGLRCFASTGTEGHLYNVSQPGELAAYRYREAVTCCCVGDELLYAMSAEGIEAFPLRTSMNAAEYTALPAPCSLGFKTFLGPKALAIAGQRLVLLTKLYDPSVPEPPPVTPLTPPQAEASTASAGAKGRRPRVDKRGRPIPDVSWNTYVLTPYDAEALHDDMVAQAKAAGSRSAYYSLILEDHFLLQAEIVSLKKVIAARYGSGATPGDAEAAELRKRKAFLAQSSGYLGDHFFETKAYHEAAQCFSVSEKRIAEVVQLFTAAAQTPRPELLEYLDRVLFDPTVSLSGGGENAKNEKEGGDRVADAVLRYYAEFAPHRLSTIVLDSHLAGYSREGALVLLRLVPKLLYLSEKGRKALLDSQEIPLGAAEGTGGEDGDDRMALIDPQEFLPKDLLAQAVLCHSLGRRKTALKILAGMRPEHIVDLCVADPALLDTTVPNSFARPLREVVPYAVLEALEALAPAGSFALPAALDADTTSAAAAPGDSEVRAFLAMLFYESRLAPLAPSGPSARVRAAPARGPAADCAEALGLLYLDKIAAHPGWEDAQTPLGSADGLRERLERNEDECFGRALVRHQKAFVSCRPLWLDAVPPFSAPTHAGAGVGSGDDELREAAYFDYTHFYTKKLEGLICSGLLCAPAKLVEGIRAAAGDAHDGDARKTFSVLLALVLPMVAPSEAEPRSALFPRLVELEPAAALDFGRCFCTGPEDWGLVMEAVLGRAKAGAADYEAVLESYRDVLDYVAGLFAPEVFIGMLPKTGSIGFFLEYIEKSCQQQVAGDMRRKITSLLTEKEFI